MAMFNQLEKMFLRAKMGFWAWILSSKKMLLTSQQHSEHFFGGSLILWISNVLFWRPFWKVLMNMTFFLILQGFSPWLYSESKEGRKNLFFLQRSMNNIINRIIYRMNYAWDHCKFGEKKMHIQVNLNETEDS